MDGALWTWLLGDQPKAFATHTKNSVRAKFEIVHLGVSQHNVNQNIVIFDADLVTLQRLSVFTFLYSGSATTSFGPVHLDVNIIWTRQME